MKDITIRGKRLRTELTFLIICFLIALGMNIYAILKYDTGWGELFSQLHVEILLAVVIYIIAGAFRLVIASVIRLFKKA